MGKPTASSGSQPQIGSLKEKLSDDELTKMYIENVARKVATEVVDSRLKPFYRHPTFTNAATLVLSGLAFIGISSFWGDVIRDPVLKFLHVDTMVAQAVQKRQYEVFMGGFQLGATASLLTEESESCNNLRASFLKIDDIAIPKSSVSSFVPSCMRLNRTFSAADDVSFVAEPGERMYLEILTISRDTPSIDDGYDGDVLSLKKLTVALAKGGAITGRDAVVPIVSRIDRDIVKLNARDSMVPVREPSSNQIYDYQSFWAWYTIPENAGQFHNLSVALPDGTDQDKYPKNFIIRVFLERNKVSTQQSEAPAEPVGK